MTTERIDMARSIADRFHTDLQRALESGSYDAYRDFISQFWVDPEDREVFLDLITYYELAGRNLNEWQPFKIFFKYNSYRQFSKYVSQFKDDDIRLGFMLR